MKTKWILFWLGAVAMLVLWLLTPYLVGIYIKTKPDGHFTSMGPVGDTFGTLTSLFSVLTTILVIAGLIMQHQEIKDLRAAANEERLRQKRMHWPLLKLDIIDIGNTPNGAQLREFALSNVGSTAGEISIEFPPQVHRDFVITQEASAFDVPQGGHVTFGVRYQPSSASSELAVIINFTTLEGDKGRVRFDYDAPVFRRQTLAQQFVDNN